MPQVLKDEVRARIDAAALEVFAELGWTGATMTGIAERAGVGAASIYRYYPGKRELFDAIVPPALAEAFEAVLDRRVRALSRAGLARAPRGADHLGEELLRFWVEHRLAVVILLDRAEGTPYAGFGDRFVDRLLAAALADVRPRGRATAATRFVLARIFENTRRMLAAILAAHADEPGLRDAIEAFWSYQIPGLQGLARWARREDERAGTDGRSRRRSPSATGRG
jgi:AcrR family transcriptional regulator